jgi:SAM-dependent methyltransferase
MLQERLEVLARDLRVGPGDSVLDYGCGVVAYRRFFPAEARYAAADLPGNPHATVPLRADGTVPTPDASFDAVLSTQVLEHVTDPALYVSECFRVLRPGGRLLLSTHGTFVYHPDPDDYWRWTCAGLQKVARDAGFEVVRFEGIVGGLPTGLQLVQDSIYWQIPHVLKLVLAAVMQTLVALADRLHSDGSRALNAQVYALVAEKP